MYRVKKVRACSIYIVSSSCNERIELITAMKEATKGNVFVVYKLDRLAWSKKKLYEPTDPLKEKENPVNDVSGS